MRIQSLYQPHFSHGSFTANSVAKNTNVGKENGLISELVYNERQPAVAQLLLPLLQQLGKQSRWLQADAAAKVKQAMAAAIRPASG